MVKTNILRLFFREFWHFIGQIRFNGFNRALIQMSLIKTVPNDKKSVRILSAM